MGCLVPGGCGFWAEPGRVLKDALWAGVVDELFAADEALLHGHLAPGAKTIGEFGQGYISRRHGRIVSEGRESCQPGGAGATAEKFSCDPPCVPEKSWYSAHNDRMVHVLNPLTERQFPL
jgi:hypothetical protein